MEDSGEHWHRPASQLGTVVGMLDIYNEDRFYYRRQPY